MLPTVKGRVSGITHCVTNKHYVHAYVLQLFIRNWHSLVG